jgi:ubiquinone/menaquinone biosynthesis C-methylase UbiE
MGKKQKEKPQGAGKSSFDLIDAAKLFSELQLKKGTTFLDMACGVGNYSLAASEIIGNEGLVYAVDLWEEGIAILREKASAKGIKNIQASVADLNTGVPIEDNLVHICLMATVLHDLVDTKAEDGALKEATRVLNPQGSFAIIEFKKIEGPPGPPAKIRLSPEEVESIVIPYGFKKRRFVQLGPYTYLIIFTPRL